MFRVNEQRRAVLRKSWAAGLHRSVKEKSPAASRGRVRSLALLLGLLAAGLCLLAGTAIEAAAATLPSSLVHTIDTSRWSIPSPDPSGLAYDTSTKRLLVGDGEVDEMSAYKGANYYESTLAGSLVRTSHTTGFSDEPVGVAFSALGKVFISDDDQRKVHQVVLGLNGVFDSSDSVSSFSTSSFGSGDPEGLSYDVAGNRLFIADGVNDEIYVVSSDDGVFGDADDRVTHFDTAVRGVSDPETVEFNPDAGTLYTIDAGGNEIVELTTSGALVSKIDTSYLPLDKPAGLAYAPRSTDSTKKSFYIADRKVDNNDNPSENDGKIYEVTAPAGPAVNQPPSVNAGPDQTITLPQNTAALDGTVSDDGRLNPTPATTWSMVSGPAGATVSFTNAAAVDTQATFPVAGTYVLRLRADDGELSASDEVTIVVNSASQPTLDVRVSVGSDDAEENASGSVSRTSTDLELVNDGSDQTVGLRFAGLRIPKGATITTAHIQFTADEAQSVATSLAIRAQAADNAATFTSSSLNVSSRSRTTASASWSPAAWSTGQAGDSQRTPDLASVVQEVINRPGWASGNALAFIVTGTGHRTASAYEAGAAKAPLLHVEWEPLPPEPTLDVSVATGSDDAEEKPSGSVGLTSTDLELVNDGSDQTVGVRFAGLGIPKGATITRAHIQFTADESQSVATSLAIRAQAADNAATFTSSGLNVSSRPRTTASASWSPAAWSTGQAGDSQRTPDLASVVQEVINRPGWASGNALAFIVTGTGHRTASAYEAGAAKAPLLHVEWEPAAS
jgi:hypothetical protein